MRIYLIAFFIFYKLVCNANVQDHFVDGTKSAFQDSNQKIWIFGGALTLLGFYYDQDVYNSFNNKKSIKWINFVGDNMGTGLVGASLALTSVGYGYLYSDKVYQEGISHAEALVATAYIP